MDPVKIEGLTPDMLWTFLAVLVGLMGIVVLVYKVIEIMRKEHERKEKKSRLVGDDVTEQIADKVMEKLQPQLDEKFDEINKKFDEVNGKLANDKETIQLHTSQLNAYEERVNKLEGGNKALCHGVFALLGLDMTSGSDEVRKAREAMKNYLIDGVYREENWQ